MVHVTLCDRIWQVTLVLDLKSLSCNTGYAKNMTQLVLSELCHICTKFDNFCHTDGRDDRIMSGILIVHLV